MLENFFDQYFIAPLYAAHAYNLVNTTVYALIALAGLYLIYRLLKHMKFDINFKFFISMIPFIILGASIRAFVDNNYLPNNFWFVSPGIWMLVATLFLLTFLVSYLIAKLSYWKLCLIKGSISVIVAYGLVFDKIQISNLTGAAAILIMFSIIASVFYFSKIKWLTSNLSFVALSAHLFDATNTSIIVDFFGGIEKHPIPRFFINLSGTAFSFFFLKLIVLIPALYLIFTELKDKKQLRNFLLIAIAVLGFSEGLRNFISLIL